MRPPVFVSRPTPHLAAQVRFDEDLHHELRKRGFEPFTLGPGSTYDNDAPLVGIRRLMTHCCGLISVAFRRTSAQSVIRKPGADLPAAAEEPLGDIWFTSPYCQIEPAMAFQLGLPILVLKERGVLAEGVLEKGVTGLYLPEFDTLSDDSFLAGEECQRLLDQWGSYVRSVFDRRGNPPKLFG